MSTITSVSFGNEDGSTLRAQLADGSIAWVPWPCENNWKEKVQKWLDAGNEIGPYVAPPPLPAPPPSLEERWKAVYSLLDLIQTRFDRQLTDAEVASWKAAQTVIGNSR